MEHHDLLQINPLVSNCFRYAGFVEKFGTGIPRMIKACMNDGNPLPEFSVFPRSISLSLKPSEEYVRKANNISALSTYSDTGSEVKESTDRCVGKDVGKALSNVLQKEDTVSRRAEILTLLGNDPSLTAEKIALILNTSSMTIERDLNLMRKKELIRREGSRTNGRWIVVRAESHN
ncbi:MAG: DeoR family transcriptional regulator [Bullifex sp.]